MVNFGEFLQAEVERPEAKHTRVFFVDYHALKERLYEIDEGGAASFEVSLGVQLTSRETTTKPTSSHNPVVKFLGLIDAEFEKVNKYVESKTKSMLVALTHMRDGAAKGASGASVLIAECERTGEELVELERFIRVNTAAFRKITKKFDKRTGERAAVWLSARLSNEFFCTVSLEPLLEMLSGCRSASRSSRWRPYLGRTAVGQAALAADARRRHLDRAAPPLL